MQLPKGWQLSDCGYYIRRRATKGHPELTVVKAYVPHPVYTIYEWSQPLEGVFTDPLEALEAIKTAKPRATSKVE